MENMKLYNKFRVTPQEARKPIKGGRLSGFTDINPMWRFKALTEEFGPCGIGWKYEITDQRTIPGAGDEVAAFVDILLYYKVNGEWSEGIPGIGGASFVSKENKGLYTSDECFKMALTDAIGVACKALGMSADIYFEKDRTKYTTTSDGSGEMTFEQAQNYRISSGIHTGKTLAEVWRSGVANIRALQIDPNAPPELKNAIEVMNAHIKRGR